MATISMWCTNPICKQALYFDTALANTTQHCATCGQAVIVPNVGNTPNALTQHHSQLINASATVQRIPTQESTSTEARRLNMGSGCFAMLAVMFAMVVVYFGLRQVPGYNPDKIGAICSLIAGIGGLVAFVFFGYIATEKASTRRGRDHQ